ncbi:MAG: ATP-binding protein [Solirubrobacteraceae bacterium]
MRDAEIADRLRERNRWWRDDHGWQRDDENLREAEQAPFDYRPGVLADIEEAGLYTLSGPRRVGKSLELRRGIASLIARGAPARNIIYCSCDDFTLQDLRRMFGVAQSITRHSEGPKWWFIDEITSVGSGWSRVVKDLRDDTPLRRDCVVLTGSSSRELRDATKNFAGRRGPAATRSDRLLMPMAFRDFCGFLGGLEDLPELETIEPRDALSRRAEEAFAELSFWSGALVEAWELYLACGGFPRAVSDFLRTGGVTPAFVQDLWDVVRGDAIRVTSLGDAELLNFLARIATGMCSPLNASKVAQDVGLGSHHSVNDRINDLTFAFQTWRCHRVSADGHPSTGAQRKVYFADPLIARIPSERAGAYSAPDVTKLSEQQLGLALARAAARGRADAFVAGGQVMYERTANAEIDFVGPSIGVPFESKYVERGWKGQTRSLAARHRRGIVATRNVLDTEGEVWAVPVSMLVWMLGS